MTVEEEVERLKQRVHDHDKLLRECEALKVCLWSTRDEVTGCQEYKRRGHGLSTSFTDSCMFFLADVNQDKRFTGVVFISSIPLLLVDRINLSNTKDHKLTSINIQQVDATKKQQAS
ncbi:hypothetical protein Bca101_087445 [Brassica carinata]